MFKLMDHKRYSEVKGKYEELKAKLKALEPDNERLRIAEKDLQQAESTLAYRVKDASRYGIAAVDMDSATAQRQAEQASKQAQEAYGLMDASEKARLNKNAEIAQAKLELAQAQEDAAEARQKQEEALHDPSVIGMVDYLRKAAQQAEKDSFEAEKDALLDESLKQKAITSMKKATEAKQKYSEALREVELIKGVLAQIEPVLEAEKQNATEYIAKKARKEHQEAVAELVKAAEVMNAAMQKERDIYVGLHYEIGSSQYLAPVRHIGKMPGSKDEYGTPLYYLVKDLRGNGYKV